MNPHYGSDRRKLLRDMYTCQPYAVALSFSKLLGYDDYLSGEKSMKESTERISYYTEHNFDFEKYDIPPPEEEHDSVIEYFVAEGGLKDNFFNSSFSVDERVRVIVVRLNNLFGEQFQVWTIIQGEDQEDCIAIMIINNCPILDSEMAGSCNICDGNDYRTFHLHTDVYFMKEDSPSGGIYQIEF